MKEIKKSDYFLTGSTESAIIYLYVPVIWLLRSFKDRGFGYFINGFGTGFFGKKGIIKTKNKLLKRSAQELDREFKKWKQKWQKLNQEFYQLATNPIKNWRANWQRLDKLSKKMWIESYKVETIDSFGLELDKLIISSLVRAGLDQKIRGELIAPAELSQIQIAAVDQGKVEVGELSEDDYLYKYWFCHGNWNGGELLTKKLLKKDLKKKRPTVDLKARKKLHQVVDSRLDRQTRNLVGLLRILSIWRDERKILMQKINLGYVRVIQDVAQELKVDPSLVKWALLEEIDEIPTNPRKFLERKKKSVISFDPVQKQGLIIVGKKADLIISKFSQIDRKSKIKGTPTSKGLISGKVKIILRKNEFNKFKKGEILVTTMTRPEFAPLMKLARAIITDEGGLTSHAAIVSRELNIPCVIGTKIATKVLKDGDLVEVDADKGVIKKIR